MLAVSSHRRAARTAPPSARFGAARYAWAFVSAILVAGLFGAASAHAQSAIGGKTAIPSDSPGIALNLSDRDFSAFDGAGLAGLSGPAIDLPVEAIGSTLFKLDLSDPTCLTGDDGCARRTERLSLGISEYITAKKDDGIDLVLRPRASFRFDEGSSSALVGAVVEIGEDLRRGSDMKTNTWYLFAGADAEALTYSPESLRSMSSGQFHLQDRIIVGDAQAGLGYRIGDADVSLSYLRREANAEGISFNEDAAALSFTWKR
ncbi:MAG: hypothetical protein AAF311_02195 [Pseudomonadota bacterium]